MTSNRALNMLVAYTTAQDLRNDGSALLGTSEIWESRGTKIISYPEKSRNGMVSNPRKVQSTDYFGLRTSDNTFDSESFQSSHTFRWAQDISTPAMSLINSDKETTQLSCISISSCNNTPIINDIATPLVHSQGRTVSESTESESLFHTKESNSEANGNESNDDLTKLKDIRLSNVNRLVIAQFNINSLRNKFEALTEIGSDTIDILVLTETKLDQTFPTNLIMRLS